MGYDLTWGGTIVDSWGHTGVGGSLIRYKLFSYKEKTVRDESVL